MPQLIILGGGPRYVFTDVSAQGLASASFSFTDFPLGDAAAGRVIVVGVEMTTSGTNFAISSVSVAGNAATSVVDRPQTDTVFKCRAALYRVSLASGETGDIDVAFAGSVSACRIGVWAMYDLASATEAFTANDGDNNGDPSSISIDIPTAGILLVSALLFSGGSATQTLSGVATVDASEDSTFSQWGSYQAGVAESGRALSFSGTGTADSARALVAASWS